MYRIAFTNNDVNVVSSEPSSAQMVPQAPLDLTEFAFLLYSAPRMKLSKNNRSTFLTITALGILIGSLGWEVFERILARLGVEISLGIGPVGFDLSVLSLYLVINPGTFLGILGGFLLIK
ncbi:MAG: hypothetical protein FVQ80_16265, partial [Planctomycetes bacterium]|nr:hypothetical protein [Planctomycetota bacterium]